jgi:Protein of unknown function (DUF3153)
MKTVSKDQLFGLVDSLKERLLLGQTLGYRQRLLSLINHRLAILFCSIAICLSGCVKYDTGINFSSLNYGEIVEHIQLGKQLNSFNQQAVRAWIASIEQRTKLAQGHIDRLSDRELKVIIPFNNAQELVTKIDQYFNPNLTTSQSVPKFNTHIQINQNNFIVLVRNHLMYDIDLRSLVTTANDSKASIESSNFVDLNFSLQSSWGVSNINDSNNVAGVKNSNDHRVNWQLKPGELNHIDAIFWLPNPLGIGAILIILVSTIGYYLKYRQLPGQISKNI